MAKTREQKLFGAAVLKMSFALRGALDSPAFHGIFPGVLRDLGVSEAEVDAFIADNRDAVEKAARGSGS
jgi:hypothetical protein